MCQVWVKCLIHAALFLLHSSPPGEVLFSLLTLEYTGAYNTFAFLVTPARDLWVSYQPPLVQRGLTISISSQYLMHSSCGVRNDWLLDEWIEPRSPALQTDSSPSEPLGKPQLFLIHFLRQFQKEHHISYYFLEEKLKYFRILHYFKYFKILKGIQSCCWFPPAFHVVFLRER